MGYYSADFINVKRIFYNYFIQKKRVKKHSHLITLLFTLFLWCGSWQTLCKHEPSLWLFLIMDCHKTILGLFTACLEFIENFNIPRRPPALVFHQRHFVFWLGQVLQLSSTHLNEADLQYQIKPIAKSGAVSGTKHPYFFSFKPL